MTGDQFELLTNELDRRQADQIRRITEDDLNDADHGQMIMLAGVMAACEANPLLGLSIQACYPHPNGITN